MNERREICSPCGCSGHCRVLWIETPPACAVHGVIWYCDSSDLVDGKCRACGLVQQPKAPRRVRVVHTDWSKPFDWKAAATSR